MITIPVYRRFSDLDPLGHVNNVIFHDYLQEARVGLVGDLDGVLGPGYSQIVVSQEIRHHRPLPYSREPVQVEVWMASAARASYTLAYRILDNDGTLVAEATTVLAVIDPDTGRPMRIPEHIKERLPTVTR